MNGSLLSACTPFETIFTGNTTDDVDNVTYSWNFGDGSTGSASKVIHDYTIPDKKYDITLTASSTLTGCTNTITTKEMIYAYPKPIASFTMDNKIIYNDASDVIFTNTSLGATSYLWNFGDGTTSMVNSLKHHFDKMGHLKVSLEVTNNQLCTDTISQGVLVMLDQLFPPNAFSPNAPQPVNREFKLITEGIATEGYHFRIISRWNDLVFEIRDEIKGWNGQLPNGTPAPGGSYVWLLDYNDFLGRRHHQNGTVTLIY